MRGSFVCVSSGRNQEFGFGHIDFEMLIQLPSGYVREAF